MLEFRDWEEVAAIISEHSEKTRKSMEQCKNKVNNLKKRYKLERHRMVMGSGGTNGTSHWPWFKTMEQIVGNSLPMMKVCLGEESFGCGMSSPVRQSKRYQGGNDYEKVAKMNFLVIGNCESSLSGSGPWGCGLSG
ncbi:Aspartate/glutamate/uridylate kinase [Artemisia annua]|uniref:Aspartate/glutamate/uridylate kinase n=1 Tax=Artemisia annua TaxID=35608 RepID=A0A2U1Q098_ARTAN|nr:Aspartate/glutamate/uridylate kinase [Artemisia annua]